MAVETVDVEGGPVPAHVDLLIEVGAALPMTGREILSDAVIAVHEGRIVHMGPAEAVGDWLSADRTIGGESSVALPGFVDTHTHVGAHFFGTVCDDENVITALYKVWFPLEYGYDSELMHAASCLGLWDAIRAGTTTVANDQYFPDATARAAARLGARALVACEINEFSEAEPITYDAESRRFTIVYDRAKAERLLSENVELIEKWKGHELVTPVLGPHAPDLLSTDMLVRCAEAAEEHDVKMLIHVAQSEAEVACVRDRGFDGSIHMLNEIGFLSPRVQAAHMVWLSDEEIEIAAASGMGMSWTPTIMMSCNSYARIDDLVRAGVRIGFGTDCFSMDVVEELRYALYSANFVRGTSGFRLNAYDIVSMATIDGARCLGLDDQIGTLEQGKRADIVLFDFKDAQLVPNTNYFESIAYRAKSRDVTHTVVEGRIVYEDGRLQLADQDEIFEDGSRLAQEWLRRSKDVLAETRVLERFHERYFDSA
jgi:5-methylthioadenosine/S-adenosylhomocysteine deaminase